MRKLLLAALLAIFSTCALAQTGAQIGVGQVWGNSTAARAPGKSETVTAILDRALGSTRGSIIERGASVWAPVVPGTTGKPWVANGAGADPAYQTLGIAGGGTNCAVASGTCLDNITGFSSTGILSRSGAGSYAFRTITGTANQITISNGDGTAGNPTAALAAIAQIATSLAINGATIGSNALAVAGSASFGGALSIGTSSASCLSAGNNAPTNPAFQIDCSTASQVAGIKVTGAVTGGTVALAAIDSGSNTNLSIDAKGTGTITIGGTSTGAITLSRATTLGGTVSGGGNQINNVVIGTSSPLAGTFTTLIANTSVSSPIHTASAALSFQSNGSTFAGSINASQQWYLGTSNVSPPATSILTVSANTAQLPAFSLTNAPQFQVASADGGRSDIAIRGFGTVAPSLSYTSARGTAASPTATQSGDGLGLFSAYGYQTTTNGYLTSSGAGFQMVATENYTSTTAGARIETYTTPTGTTAITLAATFQASGGLTVGSSTDPGVGKINALNGYNAGGTAGVTCSGTPTALFASTNGIVTHC